VSLSLCLSLCLSLTVSLSLCLSLCLSLTVSPSHGGSLSLCLSLCFPQLHLLALGHDRDRVLELKLEPLGRTSVARSISYLDNGIVYIGSDGGDSQLVKLNQEPDEANEGSQVEVSYVDLRANRTNRDWAGR
jgi:hypothetical protein